MNEMPDVALLVLHFRGETSPEQHSVIQAWRFSSPENEAAFKHFQEIWQNAAHPFDMPQMDLDKGWAGLSQALALEANCAEPQAHLVSMAKTIGPKRFGWPLFVAAMFALAAFLWLWVPLGLLLPKVVVATAAGEQREWVLADGSRVWLDSGSKITHDQRFGDKTRRVTLEGHAYFEVASGLQQFVIETPSAKVQVLGTQFDVWAGNGKTKVAVREGRVSFSALNGQKAIELGPNQFSECTRDIDPILPAAYDADKMLTWLKGRRIYAKQPLGDVVTDLVRIFGQPIEVSDPQLKEQTITATFSDETLSDILEEICLTLNMEYIEKEGTFFLISRK